MVFDPRRTTQTQTRTTVPEGTLLGVVDANQAGSTSLTPLERKLLSQAGIDGPQDLTDTDAAKRVAAVAEKLRSQPMFPELERRAPLQPKIRDISELSPAQQAEVRRKIQETQEAVAGAEQPSLNDFVREEEAKRAQQSPWPNLHEVAEMSEAEKQQIYGKLAREKQEAEAKARKQPPAAVAAIPGGAAAWASVFEDDLSAEEKFVKSLPPKPAEPMPAVCPHCQCSLRSSPPEITEQDKALYLGMILGGRFFKTYMLFDNHLQVTFRNRTPQENDMIMNQLAADVKNGNVASNERLASLRADYEMFSSIARIATSDGRNESWPSVTELASAPGDLTPLPALRAHMQSSAATSDAVVRCLSMTYVKFCALLDSLDAKKDITGFFSQTKPVRS
jgi:hypothetical protein